MIIAEDVFFGMCCGGWLAAAASHTLPFGVPLLLGTGVGLQWLCGFLKTVDNVAKSDMIS